MSNLERIEELEHQLSDLIKKVEDVKALIKDGRFVEALQLLED